VCVEITGLHVSSYTAEAQTDEDVFVDVESLAVSKIVSIVSACPMLKAYITTNDKTPFTDGDIHVYNAAEQNKKTWRGRVPVQVKGRTRHSKPKPGIQHVIPREDLEAYQKDFGVLYFMVAVDPNTSKCTPYYAVLSPAKIDWILGTSPTNRERFSIAFKSLPDEPKLVEQILTFALKTRDQNATLRFDPKLFDHVESITIHTAAGLDLNQPIVLSPDETDFALVVTTTGGMPLSIGGRLEILPEQYVERTAEVRVESGGVVFDSVRVTRMSDTVIKATMPGGLSIDFKGAGGELAAAVNLAPADLLSDRLKAVQFFVGLVETSALAIGDRVATFSGMSRGNQDALRTYLDTLMQLSELFEVLGVDETLVDFKEVTVEQVRELRVLYRAFVGKEELKNSSLKTSRAMQALGSWNLMFVVLPGSEKGKWRLVNPFDPDSRQQFSWHADGTSGNAERIRVTSFDILDEDVLPSVLNLRLPSIQIAYQDLPMREEATKLANRKVLQLLSASDSTPKRRDEFLLAARNLNDWLMQVEGESVIHLINRWQILARDSALNPEDRKNIRALSRDAPQLDLDDADLVPAMCAFLLADREAASELLSELSAERVARLKSWPIWSLWNHLVAE